MNELAGKCIPLVLRAVEDTSTDRCQNCFALDADQGRLCSQLYCAGIPWELGVPEDAF